MTLALAPRGGIHARPGRSRRGAGFSVPGSRGGPRSRLARRRARTRPSEYAQDQPASPRLVGGCRSVGGLGAPAREGIARTRCAKRARYHDAPRSGHRDGDPGSAPGGFSTGGINSARKRSPGSTKQGIACSPSLRESHRVRDNGAKKNRHSANGLRPTDQPKSLIPERFKEWKNKQQNQPSEPRPAGKIHRGDIPRTPGEQWKNGWMRTTIGI